MAHKLSALPTRTLADSYLYSFITLSAFMTCASLPQSGTMFSGCLLSPRPLTSSPLQSLHAYPHPDAHTGTCRHRLIYSSPQEHMHGLLSTQLSSQHRQMHVSLTTQLSSPQGYTHIPLTTDLSKWAHTHVLYVYSLLYNHTFRVQLLVTKLDLEKLQHQGILWFLKRLFIHAFAQQTFMGYLDLYLGV